MRSLAQLWHRHRDHFPCELGNQPALVGAQRVEPERFTALVIAQLLVGVGGAIRLAVEITDGLHRTLADAEPVHFFLDAARLPADADCTAVAHLLFLRTGHGSLHAAHRAFDRIAANVSAEGVVATYFDPTGDRAGIVDAVVCANVMRLAQRLGRTHEVGPTWDYLRAFVASGEFLGGTRYYPSPDCLLYSLSLGESFAGLREAVGSRIGASDDTVDLAQRCLAARHLDLDNHRDRARLAARMEPDGTWAPAGWFRYGRTPRWFGSRGLSTAFALAALAGR